MDDVGSTPPSPSGRSLSRRRALIFGGGIAAGAVAGGGVVAAAGRTGDRATGAGAGTATGTPTPGPAPSGYGLLAVEDFRAPGRSDDDTLAEAVRHAAAQTYKPAIVFANRSYDLTRTVQPYSGLHLLAFPFGEEFGHGQRITLPAGGLLGFDRAVASLTLENLSCQVRDRLLPAIPGDASGGAWTDVRVLGGGYDGGTTLLEGSFLRLNFQPAYVNNLSDTALRIGGSDSWLFTQGPHYLSGSLPADRPFLDLTSLGQSVVGRVYITAQGGYGVRVSGSGTGLVLDGTQVDASNRSGTSATQLAGLQIAGGMHTTVDELWVFNANVSGRSPALVTVTGGSDVVFNRPRFPAANAGQTATDDTVACIHTTVPITVIAPAAAGREKVITASSPDLVTLVAAPGWQVRAA